MRFGAAIFLACAVDRTTVANMVFFYKRGSKVVG